MENKKNDIFKFLIPAVAVVIMVESVMVVSGLIKKNKVVPSVDMSSYITNQEDMDESNVIEDTGDPKANFVFSVDSKEMMVGESYRIDVDALPKDDFSADAVDLYISYDADAFDVSGLSEGKDMPTATSMRVSDKRSVVLANFWFTESEGYVFENAMPVNMLSFVVTPKKVGSFEFAINRQDSEVGISRIVSTSDQEGKVSSLSFSSDKLTVIIKE